jgi:hypothetical protein
LLSPLDLKLAHLEGGLLFDLLHALGLLFEHGLLLLQVADELVYLLEAAD